MKNLISSKKNRIGKFCTYRLPSGKGWAHLKTVPLVTSVIAILIMLTYQISERRAYEIRAELERRRGKLGSDEVPK